jgi:hypothetical protein
VKQVLEMSSWGSTHLCEHFMDQPLLDEYAMVAGSPFFTKVRTKWLLSAKKQFFFLGTTPSPNFILGFLDEYWVNEKTAPMLQKLMTCAFTCDGALFFTLSKMKWPDWLKFVAKCPYNSGF